MSEGAKKALLFGYNVYTVLFLIRHRSLALAIHTLKTTVQVVEDFVAYLTLEQKKDRCLASCFTKEIMLQIAYI